MTTTNLLLQWQHELNAYSNPNKIKILSGFFKCGKGEYGEGDRFIGITVPDNRSVAKRFALADYTILEQMLCSPIHEYRLSALLALVERYRKNREQRGEIIAFYLSQTAHINNWDLVDLSAYFLLGDWTIAIDSDEILFKLSESADLWENRIAIVSTMAHIRKGRFSTTLALAEKYISHPHTLIHKATGWMLREMGKRDLSTLLSFLDLHAAAMPRIMLSYAIERLSADQKLYYRNLK